MSRAIPRVRVWRVVWYRDRDPLQAVYVYAPNKFFAKWNARDVLMARGNYFATWRETTRLTVARMRDDIPRSLISEIPRC